MSDGTKIEWTEATWNPITGCSLASPGCTNCYAMQLAGTRLAHHPSRAGLTRESGGRPKWTGEVRFNESWLADPLNWKRPRMIFVCAHGDLFHENVPDAWIDRVFAVMALCPQHTFQVLTKRSARMREYFAGEWVRERIDADMEFLMGEHELFDPLARRSDDARAIAPWITDGGDDWPLANVWLGVSVEDQQRADERIPDLLATPAAVRWLSCEPLLGAMDLRAFGLDVHHHPENQHSDALAALTRAARKHMAPGGASIDWIVAGGESGPNARGSTDEVEANMRSLRDQCAAAGVPFFGKQNYRKLPLPADLNVRQFPEVAHG